MAVVDRISNLHGLLAAALVLSCLLLGGGQGTIGDALCQLVAIGLIGLTLWRHTVDPDTRLPRIALLALVPFVVPVLQLLPVPDALWFAAPARDDIAAGWAGLNVARMPALSLLPSATERAALWLLPAAALFLATLQLTPAWRARLLAVVVAFAAFSVVLGVAQVAGGIDSPLRAYRITNETESVGLFANRNHFASLLVVALPLVIVGLVHAVRQHPDDDAAHRALRIAAGVGLAVLLILGIALARSRAGVVLGLLALLLSVPVAFGLYRGRGARRVLGVAVAIGVVVAVQFAMLGLMQRFEKDPFEDARFTYLDVARGLVADHSPIGAGLGSFRRVFEAADPTPGPNYVNHAHNDWLQVWLEGGWPGLGVMAIALAVLLASGWRVWRSHAGHAPSGTALQRAAWIGLLALALHSLGDYPLRTSAMLAVAGVLAAVVMAGRRDSRGALAVVPALSRA